MNIGTILKNIKTGKTIEVINFNDVTKVAMVRLEDGKTRPYSITTLKDKRQWIILETQEEEPDYTEEVMRQKEELGIEVPDINPEEVEIISKEEHHLVPMPGAEKLAELKKEYSTGKKPRISITYNGETKTPNEWAEKFGMDPKKIRLALRKGKTVEEIFNGKNK